ncbi:MAG: hypothetical protein LQ350_004081 [Teloschistes chrysophthalmus]|nr:MAG: hypothetical protein LQ350_004081 [Niorma chrysophthalma]
MSSLYNLEPQPAAKVLLETTSGDILLELFAKQTPLASRNFLQLCLDGYYNNTIFHRLVHGFVIQGGDPTGTGEGGEAIYDGGLFDDEFHSRLKFNRRGLLGMANTGTKNDNGSQFFLTLGATPELDGRNTMFGRVAGDTIYNLMKMGESDLVAEDSERPLYPTKVSGAEILVNPFDDMKKRDLVRTASAGDKDHDKGARKKSKKKGGKTLLSFGGDEPDEGVGPSLKKEKFNTRLVSAEPAQKSLHGNMRIGKDENTRPNQQSEGTSAKPIDVEERPKNIRQRPRGSVSPPLLQTQDPATKLPLPQDEVPSRSPTTSPGPDQVGKVASLLDRTNAQIAELKASMKRNVPPAAVKEPRKKSALEQMIPENATRGRKRKQGLNGDTTSDRQSLELLKSFRAKLETTPPELPSLQTPMLDEPNAEGREIAEPVAGDHEDEEAALCDLHFIANCQSCQTWDKHVQDEGDGADEDDRGWMSHALNFDKDRLGRDLNWKKKNEEELVVIDPKEKAKDIKDEQKAKRQKGTGGGGRAWDRDRDKGRLPEKRAGAKD